LTGARGRYVKAHIIPEALTETLWKGKPLTQMGRHGRHIRRQTSWYDRELVTAEGEAILARHDDWAINFFRQKKLIWSSWGPMEQLDLPDQIPGPPSGGSGLRELNGVDSVRLRLFFLSLLWRAAATRLFEFNLIALPDHELAQLREMVLHSQVEPYHFYPVLLIQLSTRNFPHNRGAGRLTKRELVIDPITGHVSEGREIHHYRFYFDGLIAHMHIGDDAETVARQQSLFVGPGSELLVLTLPSEESAEMKQFWHDAGEPPPPSFVARKSHLL
jgi:hypothetical protein